MKELDIKFKKLDPNSIIPEYMSDAASGADIFSAEEVTLETGKIKLVSTGFAISIPEGFEGQIRPRSGMTLKHGITVLNTPGTIDSDYRGEVKIILINLGDKDFLIKKGDRIAQLVITEITRAIFNTVEELDDTKRSEGGFGHTGS
ncbi:MAG TPA: dUTP diphosphatase [Candidatus Eremiobacteraeota bacterium]|nr:MAG: Deoxyuridine 5'-triphosphate nucleotidohydrolase [bacterium ADurb.Bin363]HPZ06897.1 dUTP diphosphatase [Candidatus Eremiobacteraeota bacterium]